MRTLPTRDNERHNEEHNIIMTIQTDHVEISEPSSSSHFPAPPLPLLHSAGMTYVSAEWERCEEEVRCVKEV
ncbi:hypothetical protein E2C01_024634 [Portunus trituberculatus]|uniref:Uncharacterized protein n=1 Tax=Portunus trituberculatus TaxID=210409 RepID=A0A5B7ECW4_PORTR|nr:hypothetical protein [Portunus trituberculatus]